MNFQALAFKTLFGGKPWYRSIVGWGAFVLLMAETAVPAAAEFGLADEAMMVKLTYYLERLAAAMGILGIRRRLPARGVAVAGTLALAVLVGCGGSTITMLDATGDPVTIEQSMGGRGCIAVDIGADKSVSVVLQQDASSDWAGIRVLPTIVKTALTTFFGNRDTSDGTGFSGPSDINGCQGIFVMGEE